LCFWACLRIVHHIIEQQLAATQICINKILHLSQSRSSYLVHLSLHGKYNC
jgi:predicted XRE-type DNA-binding protein